jgi:cytochrome c-type biogenesis protein CcmH/NrfG
MELLELLFSLIEQFVPIKESSRMQLESEAKDWRLSLEKPETTDAIGKLYKAVHKPWIVRLLLAVIYVPLVNYFVSASYRNNEME